MTSLETRETQTCLGYQILTMFIQKYKNYICVKFYSNSQKKSKQKTSRITSSCPLKFINQSHFEEQSREGTFSVFTVIVGDVPDGVDVLHDSGQFDPDLFIFDHFVG